MKRCHRPLRLALGEANHLLAWCRCAVTYFHVLSPPHLRTTPHIRHLCLSAFLQNRRWYSGMLPFSVISRKPTFAQRQVPPKIPRSHVVGFRRAGCSESIPTEFQPTTAKRGAHSPEVVFRAKGVHWASLSGGGGVLPLKRKQNTEDAQPSLALSMMTQFRSSTAAKGKLVAS